MNILLYFPSNKRTIPIDIPLFKLQDRGHNIFLLTTSPKGKLHEIYQKNKAKVYSNVSYSSIKLFAYVSQIFFLTKFCKKHKIDIVHSHLQQANVIAVIAQFFIQSKVVIFRHHFKFHSLLTDSELLPSKNELFGDFLINKFSRKQVVPALTLKNAMILNEGVKEQRIQVIPYIYNFNEMIKVNKDEVSAIREKYKAKLMIIMVSRLTSFKRHIVAMKPIIELIKTGLDIQLLIMDDGPKLPEMKSFVKHENMENHIHFLGFKSNILDYIAAVDVIVHPSITEASNSAIKEAALLEKIVIACNNVGDFNEYISNNKNGFLLDPSNFSKKLFGLIKIIYPNVNRFTILGKNLKTDVIERFSTSEKIVDQYEDL